MLLSTCADQDVVLVEKLRPSCTFGGSVSCCSHCGKGYESSRKLKMELLHDPAVPFLSIYPKKLKADIWRVGEIFVHPCSFPTLFTIAKSGDRSMDGEMDTQNGVHPQNGISCSLKKQGNSDVCYNTDEPWGHYAERNQSDEKGQILGPQRRQTQRQKVDGGGQGLGVGEVRSSNWQIHL